MKHAILVAGTITLVLAVVLIIANAILDEPKAWLALTALVLAGLAIAMLISQITGDCWNWQLKAALSSLAVGVVAVFLSPGTVKGHSFPLFDLLPWLLFVLSLVFGIWGVTLYLPCWHNAQHLSPSASTLGPTSA